MYIHLFLFFFIFTYLAYLPLKEYGDTMFLCFNVIFPGIFVFYEIHNSHNSATSWSLQKISSLFDQLASCESVHWNSFSFVFALVTRTSTKIWYLLTELCLNKIIFFPSEIILIFNFFSCFLSFSLFFFGSS